MTENKCALDWNDAECERGGFSLIGQFISEKQVNVTTFRKMIAKIWNVKHKVEISEEKDNAFVFSFGKKEEYDRVWRDSPWAFDGCLLNLRPWTKLLTVEEVRMNKCLYWVQIHNIPKEAMTKKNIVRMGTMVGEVICFEEPRIDDCNVRSFGRIRVEVDLQKPLKAGFWLDRPGDLGRIWAKVKYEKLQSFCYGCGIVGHDVKKCKNEMAMSEVYPQVPMYSAELRVNPVRAIAAVIMIREGEYDSVQMGSARESTSLKEHVDNGKAKGKNIMQAVTQQGSTGSEGALSVNSPEEKTNEAKILSESGPSGEKADATSPLRRHKGRAYNREESKGKMVNRACRKIDFNIGLENMDEAHETNEIRRMGMANLGPGRGGPKCKEVVKEEISHGPNCEYPCRVSEPQKVPTQISDVRSEGEGQSSTKTTEETRMIMSKSPYFVELPEESEESSGDMNRMKMSPRIEEVSPPRKPTLLQLTYEKVLVSKLERVNLKRTAEEGWEESEMCRIKRNKLEIIEERVPKLKEPKVITRGRKISPKKKKVGKGRAITKVLKLVEVPVRQLTNVELISEGLGGLPSKTTKEP